MLGVLDVRRRFLDVEISRLTVLGFGCPGPFDTEHKTHPF